jgi:Tfp pilus assembly protein PilF
MPSAESDLAIVSLVRYADSCDPTSRHGDCPFAVERQGKLTCHEECRGVIKSLLRRGRGEPTSGAEAFDARQLLLNEPPGAPDILWHTSSLLQIVARAARSNPFRQDGTLELQRLVYATSALGALGSRGLNPEYIIRYGVAGLIKLGLAAWLGGASDRRLSDWPYLARWRTIFENAGAGKFSAKDYLDAAFDGPVARYMNAWIATASIDDVLMWRPASLDTDPVYTQTDDGDIEIWTWVVERFTQTYLDRWSLSSLKREYTFVQGSWQPDFPTEIMTERVVGREKVATALADRAIVSSDELDPSMLNSFIEQALALLRDDQRAAAAALFSAARMLKPKDLDVQNNYAFCILIDKPEEAKSLLVEVLKRRRRGDPAISWCNLAVAEFLLGCPDAALEACEQAYASNSLRRAHLWMHKNGEWAVETVTARASAAHLGVELERSMAVSDGKWAERLKNLTPLGERATSSDLSSGGTDEEDP